MNHVVYKMLKKVASKGDCEAGLITYSAVGALVGLDMQNPADRNKISDILGEISTYEHKHGRPMLSSVVVLQETWRPGTGFFDLAKELGLQGLQDDDEFHVAELRKTWECWKTRKA